MNIKQLLLKLLPGMLPLLIFIVADEIWGTRVGLAVAIAVGIEETIRIKIKEKRIDKFIIFDTALIVSLGAVSIILDNDVFFKLKPGIIGVIICLMLGVSAFTPRNYVLAMSQRYFADMQITEEQQKQLLRSLRIMFFIFLLHTALIFYSVWFMSKEAWAFISGGLFYILMGVYFVYEYVNKKFITKQLKNEEWLPVVDEDGNVKGKATRTACHNNKELMHPVVHLHVFNKKGELYLQKRPENKEIQPGKWDTAVGGHVALNETIEKSLVREAKEELGISHFIPRLVMKYKWESDVETELVFCFMTKYEGEVYPSEEELDGGRFWSIKDIRRNMGRGVFTPNFEHEFKILVKSII